MLVSVTDQKLGTGTEMDRALKINVIGGGPGGLYFSLLMKLANPRHEITIFERNLWWYIAIITAIIALSKSFIHDNIFKANPQEHVDNTIKYTHYHPIAWNQLSIIKVYAEVSSLLKFKTTLLLLELFGVFVTPFILIFYLRSRAKVICNFFKDEMYKDTKIGYICKSSIFPDEQNEQENSKIHKSLCNFIDNYGQYDV